MTINNQLLRILLAGSLATSLVACGGSDEDTPTTGSDAGMDNDGSGMGDTGVTDVMEPDAMEPDAMEPDAMEPDAMEPDATEPDTVETDGSTEPALGNIVEVAEGAGTFTTLLAALDTAELTATLEGEGPFTVFAPSDEAFTAFLAEAELTADDLLADPGLSQILLYHVVVGAEIGSADLTAGPFTTGADLTAIAATEGGVAINGIDVVTADVPASNGVIHVIDGVLLPPTIAELAGYAGGFDTLLTAVTQEGLAEPLSDAEGTFTVFAPTDTAFGDLLTALEITAADLLAFELEAFAPYISLSKVLQYHVIAGAAVESGDVEDGFVTTLAGYSLLLDTTDGVTLNDGPSVALADLKATNGVIHVIDGVLLPPNIVELAQLAGGFDVLLQAATTAEFEPGVTVADILSAVPAVPADNSTVFAPTDDAFTALLAELEITAEDLLNLEELVLILAHHVIPGNVLSTDITPGFYEMADELNTVIAPNEAGDLLINDAVIGPVDIVGTNGVIHVIDKVIFASDIPTLLSYHPSFSTLVTALSTADLVGAVTFDPASTENGQFTVFAPTNDAFGALLAELEITAADLLANPDLADILLFHVAAEAFFSGDLTVEGVPVLGFGGSVAPVVFNDDGSITIGGAQIDLEQVDIEAVNGVIHVLDGVMRSEAG